MIQRCHISGKHIKCVHGQVNICINHIWFYLILLSIAAKYGKQNTHNLFLCPQIKSPNFEERGGRKRQEGRRILARGLRGMSKKWPFSLMFGRIKSRPFCIILGSFFIFHILFYFILFSSGNVEIFILPPSHYNWSLSFD